MKRLKKMRKSECKCDCKKSKKSTKEDKITNYMIGDILNVLSNMRDYEKDPKTCACPKTSCTETEESK